MRFTRLPDDSRVAPPVVAVLLCVAFLFCAHQFSEFTAGSGVSPNLTVEHSTHSGSMGTAAGYVPAALEDVEAADGGPVNAENLTALLLVFFGMSLGLLFGGWRWRESVAYLLSRFRFTEITRRPPPVTAPSRLSVFLL